MHRQVYQDKAIDELKELISKVGDLGLKLDTVDVALTILIAARLGKIADELEVLTDATVAK